MLKVTRLLSVLINANIFFVHIVARLEIVFEPGDGC